MLSVIAQYDACEGTGALQCDEKAFSASCVCSFVVVGLFAGLNLMA